MKLGELVVHAPTGKRLTIKRIDKGSGFVLCSWPETKSNGQRIECSGAFKWDELRYPTAEERAEPEPAPAMAQSMEGSVPAEAAAETVPAGVAEAEPEPAHSEPVQTEVPHKRRR